MHRDFVFALRQLRTNLRFSLIIVLTLALGIGATTAIFSVVSGVLLRALPFPESERLISPQTVVFPQGEAATKEADAGTIEIEDVSFPDFFDWREPDPHTGCHRVLYLRHIEEVHPGGKRTADDGRGGVCVRRFLSCAGRDSDARPFLCFGRREGR